MQIPENLLQKYRTFTNGQYREFIKMLESEVSVKAMCTSGLSDPDVMRMMKCVISLKVLLERAEANAPQPADS